MRIDYLIYERGESKSEKKEYIRLFLVEMRIIVLTLVADGRY